MNAKPDTNEPQRSEADADVEGHALPLVQAVSALVRGRTTAPSDPKASNAPLPPLTKPFPRLKDDGPR
jgi:hypothetical protein